MIIEQIQDNNYDAWDAFVLASNNGTVFHRPLFLQYHHAEKFQHHPLMVRKRGDLYGAIPCVLREEPDGMALVSHPGASYGGIVIPSALRFDDAEAIVAALTTYAKNHQLYRIDLTLPPTPYMRHPHQNIEFALVRAGFGYRKRELTNIVPLDTPLEDVLQNLPPKTRADIRQAQKLGLQIKWSDYPSEEDLAILYQMLKENRKDLGLDNPPTHTLEELIRIRDLLPDMMLLGMTYAGKQAIASTLVFRCNPQALLTFYICHARSARDKHPVHILLYDLICQGIQKKFRILDFGISTVNMKPLNSLIRFKESMGGQGFFRDSFELKL